MRQVVQHLERFDPREGEGTLIDTEHRARYWWAARAVAGQDVLDAGCGTGYGIEILAGAGAASVTGVDVDPTAVEEARQRFGESAQAILEGDLHDLPFDDDSFDVAVCFEAIEHLEDGDRALAELRRVLRPDGVLFVSSPNPDVYPAGNEHHVHEYRPRELAAAVGEHFAGVRGYAQHAWLASTIEPAGAMGNDAFNGNGNGANGRAGPWQPRRTATLDPGQETFGIVVAGDAGLPGPADIVSLGDAFEVGWWSEQVENGRAEAEKALAMARAAEEGAGARVEAAEDAARAAIAAVKEETREQMREVRDEAHRELAQANRREAAALERRQRAATSLLEANQRLAHIPLLEHRLAVVAEEHAQVSRRLAELEGSKSWRLTAPIRRLRRLFGGHG